MLTLTWPEPTRAHGWPAGAKLAALAAFTLLVVGQDHPALLITLAAGVLALTLAPGRRFALAALRGLRPIWPFVLVILALHLWRDSPASGARTILRLLTCVLAANLLTLTTPLSQMLAVFQHLAQPLRHFGLCPQALAITLTLVIRFIPVLLERSQRIADAIRARSPARRPGWRLIAPTAISALDDAEHLGDALRARGGVGQGK